MKNKWKFRLKPIVAMLLSIAMIVSFSGCGSKSTAEPSGVNSDVNEEAGNDSQKSVALLSSEYVYGADGELTSIVNYEYNSQGLLQGAATWKPYDSGDSWYISGTVSYKYDASGNVIQEIQRDKYGEDTVEYKYDEDGNRICENMIGGYKIEYYYDDSGNLIKDTSMGVDGVVKSATEYIYDANGNKISSVAFWYDDAGEPVNTEIRDYTYDDQGHMLSAKSREFEDDWALYTYDDAGNLIKEENQYGDMYILKAYTYDENNRLVSKEENMGDYIGGYNSITTYTYDDNGNVISKNVSDRGCTVYNYVAAVETETDNSWRNAYLNYVKTELEDVPEESRFYLVDMDGDHVPELYIDFMIYANGMKLCSFDGSRVNEMHLQGWGVVSYIPNTGYVLSSSGHHGIYSDNVYCVKDGCINSVASGSWNDIEANSHSWNGESVTEEAYNDNLQQVFDTSSAVSVVGVEEKEEEIVIGPNPYSYAQIQSILS